EAVLFKTVAHLMKVKNAAMHGPASALRRIKPRAKPLKVRSFAAVHFDTQETGGRELQRVLRAAFDGLGKFLRRDLTERQVNSREMFAIIQEPGKISPITGTSPAAVMASLAVRARKSGSDSTPR